MSANTPFKAISFDCYGTLINWHQGLVTALGKATGQLDPERLLELVAVRGEVEWEMIAGLEEFRPYRELVAASLLEAAPRAGFPIDAEQAAEVGASIGLWPPFPDAPPALARLADWYQLAIASNVDRQDIARSAALLGVEFTRIVTAEDVQCYKPEPDHLMALVHELGFDEEEILHVSSYPEYDLGIAADLGIPAAYVNRLGHPLPAEFPARFEVPDMTALARQLLGGA